MNLLFNYIKKNKFTILNLFMLTPIHTDTPLFCLRTLTTYQSSVGFLPTKLPKTTSCGENGENLPKTLISIVKT